MFKIHDLWGIFAGMLTLIALYLIIKYYTGGQKILQTLFSGTSTMITDLQGR